jgi:glycerol uptake facilitator-like aquaporin
VAIARSLMNTFSGIRPVDLPGFIAAQCFGALCALALVHWFLRTPTSVAVPVKAEARL